MPLNNKIRKLLPLIAIGIGVLSVIASEAKQSSDQIVSINNKKVLISQVVEHPALDATTKGIIDALDNNGFKRGVNIEIRIESAQANAALASQIASKFVNQNPDIVVGIGTMSAQSFAKYAATGKIKLAFSSVTDPLGASLVQTLAKPGNNTSGVSNFVDLEPQIKLFQQLQPTLKKLGILYNPGEINSVSIVNKLKELAPQFGLTITPQTAAKTADVAQAAIKLANNVDAIFISNDNTALSSFQSIIKAANAAKIPVYVSDTDVVTLGALAALGPNQYNVGLQTGNMIARSLNGENLSTIPVEFPKQTELYINLDAAKIVGVVIPKEILQTATQTIKNSKE